MGALRLTPANSPLLRPDPTTQRRALNVGVHGVSARRNFRPFIAATLSNQTAEISPKPSPSSSTVVTSENGALNASPPVRKRVSADSLQYPAGYVGAVPVRTVQEGDDDGGIIDAMSYLTNILSSQVYDVAIETPLQLAPKLSERLGVKVWLKREDLQPVSMNWVDNVGCRLCV